eukprot:5547463-Pyramimonas_sp.AAC.1
MAAAMYLNGVSTEVPSTERWRSVLAHEVLVHFFYPESGEEDSMVVLEKCEANVDIRRFAGKFSGPSDPHSSDRPPSKTWH